MSTHGLFGSAASRVVSVGSWSRRHKVSTVVILALLGWGAYVAHGALFPTVTPTKYAVEAASKGTITTSVSGTGQVSASSEIAVTPQTTSGAVTAILVKAGDLVHKGDPVAKLDDTDAAKALRNAELSYQSAQLSYAKLMEPSSTSTLLQSQNSVSSAEESIASTERAIDTAYVNTFHDIADGHTSLGATIDNLTTLLEGNNAYANSIQILIYNKTAQAERKQADAALTAAKQTRAVFAPPYNSPANWTRRVRGPV